MASVPTAERSTRRRGVPPGPSSISSAWNGAEYTAEQLEFLRAIDRYKVERRRPHPTWPEVLAIAVSLGYRRVAELDVHLGG